jgi:multidrug efflux system membrane fusion protein
LMSWTQVKAPASGRVVERSVDAGAAIFPGTPLLVLESTANPQVLANIPTEHADLLSVGRIVRLKGTEIHDPLVGRIAEIVPLSDPATHSVQFKVDLPPSFAMPSGQFIKVEVPAGNRNAIVVPQHAIRETGQLTGLFVVDSASRARFRLVKTEAYAAGRIEVLSGVEPGEKIVTNLSDQIFDGIPVEARERQKSWMRTP